MADLGSVERHGSKSVIRFQRRFAHPIEQVWRAITEPALAAALDGKAVDWPHWPMDEWERIHEEYVNRR